MKQEASLTMGNNGSRIGHITQCPADNQQWAYSFPRNHPRPYQHKVLPERENKKLRSTNNGEILQAGGTISSRHQQTLSLEREEKPFRIFRTSSISSSPSEDFHHEERSRNYMLSRGVPRYAAQKYEHEMKKFGSVPDLRRPSENIRDERNKFRGRKKYKAPPPPKLYKSNGNAHKWDDELIEPIVRRARLFKTKAELKKKYSSPIKSTSFGSSEDKFSEFDVQMRESPRKDSKTNRLSLPVMYKSNGVQEFQAELKEVIQRIKSTKHKPEKIKNQMDEKLKTLDHNISRRRKIDLEPVIEKNGFDFDGERGQPSGKESTPEKPQTVEEKKSLPKIFYFGMNEQEKTFEENAQTCFASYENNVDNNVVDHFASTLQPYCTFLNSSVSDISSELEMDKSQISSSGIALQLRPILPKKQLEIPRFSPAAAWKLLSAVESNLAPSTTASDEGPVLMEDKIEKLARPPPPPPVVQVGPRSSYDKSGDSGISGDAGPAPFDDSPEVVDIRSNLQLPLVHNRSQGISWTPQQDLGEEESSTDEELQHHSLHQSTPVKFIPKSNVFSLSLPRENHLSSYIAISNTQSHVGLQKLKRSVSGVLGGLAKKDAVSPYRDQSKNWFFSKSAPTSINNGFNSLEMHSKAGEIEQPLVGKNTHNVSRIMYLPELDNLYVKRQNTQKRQEQLKNKQQFKERSKSAERSQENFKAPFISKSTENIMKIRSSPEPEDLQDPPKQESDKLRLHKSKRFTFQSTIRQIERRRLAERLSREAEKKEKQRLSELEAMQRVEEEFQKKRAREKASIRQQLRLFSLDENAWSSLPPNLEIKDEVSSRSEPDGAVSSSTSSLSLPMNKTKIQHAESPRRKLTPTSDSSDENIRKTAMTQILSEYRQPQREYKDFRGSPRYRGDHGDHVKQTIHPQVTYNMPKASERQETEGSSNYRKQFAHGVKNKSGESTYSDDSQSTSRNYSPNIFHNKNTPISRF